MDNRYVAEKMDYLLGTLLIIHLGTRRAKFHNEFCNVQGEIRQAVFRVVSMLQCCYGVSTDNAGIDRDTQLLLDGKVTCEDWLKSLSQREDALSVSCPMCEATVEHYDRYCSRCAHQLKEVEHEKWHCPRCHKKVWGRDAFCRHCGIGMSVEQGL